LKRKLELDPNLGHGLFVGWVKHSDIFCWVSFLYPTYLSAIIVLSTKPNKMAEDKTIPAKYKMTEQSDMEWIRFLFFLTGFTGLTGFCPPAASCLRPKAALS